MILDSSSEIQSVVGMEQGEGLFSMNSCLKNKNQTKDESSSSIGKDSDDASGNSLEKSGDSEEVQSPFKGPLDAMEALENVLPMRRGISKFYNGKSKSFASLTDASASLASMKDLAKPENAYTRRRRNLLANSLRGNVSKKSNGIGKSKVAFSVAMVHSGDDKQEQGECYNSGKPLVALRASYSLADLHQARGNH